MKTLDENPLNIWYVQQENLIRGEKSIVGLLKAFWVTSLLLSHMFLDMVKLQQEALNTNWLTGLEMQTLLHPASSLLQSPTRDLVSKVSEKSRSSCRPPATKELSRKVMYVRKSKQNFFLYSCCLKTSEASNSLKPNIKATYNAGCSPKECGIPKSM